MKNIDIDTIDKSDDEYFPSSAEGDVLFMPPREKSIRKSQYPFKCDVCYDKFLSGVSVQVHEKLAHKAKATSTQKHACPQCLKIITSLYNMLRHLEKQHEARKK